MKKLRRIIRPASILAALVLMVAVLGFVERTADRTPVAGLDIRVKGAEGMHFIDEESIRREVMDMGEVIGAPMRDVELGRIEQRLRNIPWVAQAEVFHTHDGVLHVRVVQRVPIARVLEREGPGFYICEDGHTMPTSTEWTARVPVVVGAWHEAGVRHGFSNVFANDSLMEAGLGDEIHSLVSFLRSDPFLHALVDQIVVNGEGEFELIPRAGGHRILIGDATGLEQRFEKLKLFHEKGIHKSGWRKYGRVDLRFAGQIVCTQRTTP